MGPPKMFKRKDEAVEYMEKIVGGEHVLFAEDLGYKGAKSWVVATEEQAYMKVFKTSGAIRSGDHHLCEWLQRRVKFGIDFDLDDIGNKYGADYDCRPQLQALIAQVNAVLKNVFDVEATERDWIALYSEYRLPRGTKEGKHSFHLILGGYYFEDMYEMRDFAALIEDPTIDRSFYQTRCCRTLGSTKKKEKYQYRPLVPYKLGDCLMPEDFPNHRAYYMATLLHASAGCRQLSLPLNLRPGTIVAKMLRKDNEDAVDLDIQELVDNGGTDVSEATLTGLVECLSVERATAYDKWIRVGFALVAAIDKKNEQTLLSIFDNFSKTAPNYSPIAVKKQWKVMRKGRGKGKTISVGSLFAWAKKDDEELYKWTMKTRHIPTIILKELLIPFPESDENSLVPNAFGDEGLTIDYLEYDDRWTRPYPIETYDGIIAVAGMGAGKTEANIGVMKGAERLIKISPRRLYSCSATNRLHANGIDVANYLEHRDRYDLAEFDKLIVSPESCWRVWSNRQYDVFIGDEIETIMESLTCERTHRDMPAANMAFLECLTKAKKFVLSDAHVGMKTLEYVRSAFKDSGEKLLFVRNTQRVIARKAVHLRHKCKSSRKMYRYWEAMIEKIVEDLKVGKNVVVFTANKSGFGDALYAKVKEDEVVPPEGFKYYHKDSVQDITKLDINEEWKGMRLVIYTPVITVGCSFDIKDWFHSAYAFLSCRSVNVKGSIQATARVRHLIEDKLTFMINDIPERRSKHTLQEVIDAKQKEKELKAATYQKEIASNTALSIRDLQMHIDSSGSSEEMLANLKEVLAQRQQSPAMKMPEMEFKTFCYNTLEDDLDHANFVGNFYRLLEETGYKTVEVEDIEVPEEDEAADKTRVVRGLPPLFSFANLRNLTKGEYRSLEKQVKYGGSVSREERWAMHKYAFVHLMIGKHERVVSEEDQALLFNDYMMDENHRQWLFNAYNQVYKTPQSVMDKSLKACPYEEVVTCTGALMSKVEEIWKALDMRNPFDFEEEIEKSHIEEEAEELGRVLHEARTILGMPSKSKKLGSFRCVLDGLNLIYGRLFGLKFKNVIEQSEKQKRVDGRMVACGRYQLDSLDDFSELLYSCSLLSSNAHKNDTLSV